MAAVRDSLAARDASVSKEVKQRLTHSASGLVEPAPLTDQELSTICSTRDHEALLLLGGSGAVLKLVGVDAALGVSPSDVAARRERFGANTFPEKAPRSLLAFIQTRTSQPLQRETVKVKAAVPLVRLSGKQVLPEGYPLLDAYPPPG